jgi:hypothetical protein
MTICIILSSFFYVPKKAYVEKIFKKVQFLSSKYEKDFLSGGKYFSSHNKSIPFLEVRVTPAFTSKAAWYRAEGIAFIWFFWGDVRC